MSWFVRATLSSGVSLRSHRFTTKAEAEKHAAWCRRRGDTAEVWEYLGDSNNTLLANAVQEALKRRGLK